MSEFTGSRSILDGIEIYTSNVFCRKENSNVPRLIANAAALKEQQGIPASEPWRITELPCSMGKETWSIAAGLAMKGIEFHISAYDINPVVLNMAKRRYEYSKDELARDFGRWGLPFDCVDFFDQVSDRHIRPNAELRKHVTFAQADIRNDRLPTANVVITNNLMQYLTKAPSRDRIIGNLASMVEPEGILTLNTVDGRVQPILHENGLSPDDTLNDNSYPYFFRRRERGEPVIADWGQQR